jgi:hypothetical protein
LGIFERYRGQPQRRRSFHVSLMILFNEGGGKLQNHCVANVVTGYSPAVKFCGACRFSFVIGGAFGLNLAPSLRSERGGGSGILRNPVLKPSVCSLLLFGSGRAHRLTHEFRRRAGRRELCNVGICIAQRAMCPCLPTNSKPTLRRNQTRTCMIERLAIRQFF